MPEIGLQSPLAHKEHYSNATEDFQMKLCSLWEAECNWLHLPYEVWLSLLVDYGITARDLVNLEYTCRWFGNYWGGELYQASVLLNPTVTIRIRSSS